MFEKKVVVNNKTGLHARPASELMKLCSKSKSNIMLLAGNAQINPKSIISILGGGVHQGTEVTLQISGEDEAEFGPKIIEFISNLTD